jgi:hypothetical protein
LEAWNQSIRFPRRVHVPPSLRVDDVLDLPGTSPYSEGPARPIAGRPILLRPPLAQTLAQRSRNINLISIGYAFRPRLRPRLTLGRLTLPRKPWAYGEWVFHPFYRYSCQHTHFPAVHRSSRSGFNPAGNAPLPRARSENLTHPRLRQCA